MTVEQYKNWRDFATRMAATVYSSATKSRRKKIADEVASYFYWREFQKDWPEINSWDGNGDDYFLGNDVDEFFDHYLHWNSKNGESYGKLHNQITCCIRAGFNLAVQQSGGVFGFTIGDVRKMYDGKVPLWVTSDNFGNKPDDVPI